MVYNKQQWKNFPSEETPINAARLSHMETQYEEALSEAQKYTDETVSTIPAGPEGPPGPMGDVTPEAIAARDAAQTYRNEARTARDQAEMYASDAGDIQDTAVAGLLLNASSETRAESAKLAVSSMRRFTPQAFGAVADGVTDDRIAVQSALDAAAAAGGELFFPPGRYFSSDAVVLRSNVTITGGRGAILTKLPARAASAWFASLSGGVTGYGSGVRNVRVSDLTFEGSFTPASRSHIIPFALHHAEGLLFERLVFRECASGHIFDLGGCRDITIRQCEFVGFDHLRPGVNVGTEAIQIDASGEGLLSYPDLAGSFDGLPTTDVRVEGCTFRLLVKGSTRYPAPNPMGSHTATRVGAYSDLSFVGNVCYGVVAPAATGYTGALGFVNVRRVNISRNTFVPEVAGVPDKDVVVLRVPTSGVNNQGVIESGSGINSSYVDVKDNFFQGAFGNILKIGVGSDGTRCFSVSAVGNNAIGGSGAIVKAENVSRCVVSGNISNGYTIADVTGELVLIEGNETIGAEVGVKVGGAAASSSQPLVASNVIRNASIAGVLLDTVFDGNVSGNTIIMESGGPAVEGIGTSWTTIGNNSMRSLGSGGAGAVKVAGAVLVAGNSARGWTEIVTDSPGAIIHGNMT